MSRIAALAVSLFSLLAWFPATGSLNAQVEDAKPSISQAPLTGEQLAVYRTVLVGWFQSERFSVNLAERTSVADSMNSSDETACMKGLSPEKQGNEVHRFRKDDLPQLGVGSNIHLVDPDAHARQVHEHDPGNAIRNGTSVDDAVKEGFAHGLFTFGEIRFDSSHTHAVVSFSFWCGSLCGNGSTMLLEKKDGIWKQKKQCGGWVS